MDPQLSIERPTLRDFVMAVLSLTSTIEGRTRITDEELYAGFAELYRTHPEVFPIPMRFTHNGKRLYSKSLDTAVQLCLPYTIGINVENDLLLVPDTAILNLGWLHARYGGWVETIQPIAHEFACAIPQHSIQ